MKFDHACRFVLEGTGVSEVDLACCFVFEGTGLNEV